MPAKKQTRTIEGASNNSTRAGRKDRFVPSPDRSLRGTIAKNNNTWYSCEDGENKNAFSTGSFRPVREPSKAAFNKSDNYTRGRNAAADTERYTYMTDCNDIMHRDYSLRFSNPTQSTKAKESYTVLPDMKYAHGTAILPNAVKKQLVKQGKLDTVGNENVRAEVTALKARESRMTGMQAQNRFVAYTSELPPV